MIIYSHPDCLTYGTPGHPERPARVEASLAHLKASHPAWQYSDDITPVAESVLLQVHSESHLKRLQVPSDFDPDTAYHSGIYGIARLAVGGALAAMEIGLSGGKAFSLMRPPGHHAEQEQAMGFCYLSTAGICAIEALARGMRRVAIWDFDVHHGNGTEAVVSGRPEIRFVSVHQVPCYPGTGLRSIGNSRNFPVAPGLSSDEHMAVLRQSWQELLDFEPELVLVSAGFDAYVKDTIAQMTLKKRDFQTLGAWLNESRAPVVALLEGGYSDDLPDLIDAFLVGWEESK